MSTQPRHSAACTQVPFRGMWDTKVQANLASRRSLLAAEYPDTIRRAAEGLEAAQEASQNWSYALKADRVKRLWNRSLDGSTALDYLHIAHLPECGAAGERVLLSLVTPILRDVAHRPMREEERDGRGVEAAHAGFFEASGHLAASYITFTADGHLDAEERRKLDALLAKAQSWLDSARAAVRRP